VAAIPDEVPYRPDFFGSRRGVMLLVAALLVAMLVGGAIAVGAGLLRLPWLPDDRDIVADDLQTIVTAANLPDGMNVYLTLTGRAALDASDTAPVDSPGFVDAVLSGFDADDEHEGDHEGRYWTFAARFETEADAERAFDAAAANLASPAGWGLSIAADGDGRRIGYDPDPGLELGNESVLLVRGRGTDYGCPQLSVYLWRVDNVLLQAVDFHPYDRGPSFLQWIAEGMDARAH
jgi:hypothetical protein